MMAVIIVIETTLIICADGLHPVGLSGSNAT